MREAAHQGQVEGVATRRLPAAERLPCARLDVLHVTQRLERRCGSGALDGARAGVVGRERKLDVAEAIEHLSQVARAGEDVGARFVAGQAKLVRGRRHQLEQPAGADAGPAGSCATPRRRWRRAAATARRSSQPRLRTREGCQNLGSAQNPSFDTYQGSLRRDA
jgi:hypothetical protein